MNDLEDVVLDDATDVVSTDVEESVQADVPVTEPVAVAVKGTRGRKVDTTGKTALGSARLLYAANPSMSAGSLKALFLQELTPKFGTNANTASTYVSMCRKKS